MRKAPILISVAAAVAAALGGGLAWQSAGTSSPQKMAAEIAAQPTASPVAMASADSPAASLTIPAAAGPAPAPATQPIAAPAPPVVQPAPAPSIILQLVRQAQTEPTQPYRPGTAMIPRPTGEDPDFGPFLQRLRRAVRDRDADYIQAIADENIQLSFGRSQPLAERMEASNGIFWQQLERALTPGCAPNGVLDHGENELDYWSCPPAFLAETQAPDLDFYNQLIVDGTDVAVRQLPSLDSPVLARVSNTVLRQDYLSVSEETGAEETLTALRRWYDQSETLTGWQYVNLPDGRRGFISSRYAYAALGYRAVFERNGQGDWTMTAFIAGD